MRGTQNLFGRFLSIFGAKLVTTVIALLSTPIIVRLLGPGNYGDYAVFLSIFALYMIPISSGITEGVQKFVAENRDQPHWREGVIRFYTLLAIGTVAVGAVVLLALTISGVPAWLYGQEFTLYFYFLALYIVVAQFRALGYHIILGFGLEPISESLNVVRKLGTVTVGIVFVLLGYGVAGMIVGHIVTNVVLVVVASVVVAKRVSLGPLLGADSPAVPGRELLWFNGRNIVLVLLLMSLYHVDIVMLRAFAGSETTGFYKAALQIAEYIWIVPMALQLLLLHSTSTLWSEGRTGEITTLATRITRYSVLLVTLMAVGVAVLAHRFIPLYYGGEFTGAVGPLLLLLPGAVGFAVARPLQAISQGSGDLTTLIVATGAGAAANLALNAALIPTFGMHGAAIATSLSYGSMFGLYVWAARSIGYDPLQDFRGVRIALVVVLVTPVLWSVDTLIGSDLLAFLVVPVVGTAIFVAVAVTVGAIGRDEIVSVLDNATSSISATREASD